MDSFVKRLDASIWMLVGANLIPLFGVVFWEWSTFEVVALYWLENVVLGGVNILKMITCSPSQDQEFGNEAGNLNHRIKVFLVPFFTFHYGFFCFVHGIFVFALLGEKDGNGGMMSQGPGLGGLSQLVERAVEQGGKWAVLALVLSHLFSFATNYLGKGEYRRISAPQLMFAPYARIVVLHVAILFGAFAIVAMGSPILLLVLLILGKILIDVAMHNRSHQKLSEAS